MKKEDENLIERVISIDAGNNSIKVKVNVDGGKRSNYDNVYSERDSVLLEKEYLRTEKKEVNSSNMGDFLDVRVSFASDDTNKIETYSFVFGNQAKKYISTIRERNNKYKSTDKQLVMNAIVAGTNSVLKEMKPSELKDKMEIGLTIKTGIPFNEYENPQLAGKYKDMFKKDYKIEFLNKSYPVREVLVKVKDVVVGIEGVAALQQALVKKVIPNKTPKEIKNKVFVMIDIGCFTTDVAGYKFIVIKSDNGEANYSFEPIEGISTGLVKGVGSAMEATISRIKYDNMNVFGQHGNLYRQQIAEAIAEEDNMIEGLDLCIEPYFSEECTKLGKYIGETVSNLIASAGIVSTSVLNIYISGGGSQSEDIVKKITESFELEGYDKNSILISDDPIFANADGYLGE